MFPILFEINIGSFHLPIHTYGLMIAIGFLLGVYTVRRLSVRSGVNPDQVSDLAFWLLMIGFVGARILFVITKLDFFLANPAEIFKVWEGGLVFFGGLITASAYAIYFVRRHQLSVWKMMDILLPGVVIAHAMGRFGCLAAGCCYGRPTGVPWGIRFHSELVDESLQGIPLHPTQLYEAVALLILYAGMLSIFKRRRFEGQVGLTYFMVYPVVRSIIEIFRGDTVRGFVIGNWLSTSQFISIFIFIAGGAVLMRRLKQADQEIYAQRR